MRAAAASGAILGIVVLVACASPDASLTTLPDGVTVDVYQTRTDLPARGLEIAIANGSDADLTITAASFDSAQFIGPAVWSPRPGGTLVRAGTSVDLPVRLPAASCDDPDPVGTVRIEFVTPAGAHGSVATPAIDRFDRLPAMRAEECLADAIAAVARLTIDEPVRIEASDHGPIAFLSVAYAPSGGSGTVTIDAAEHTVLLALPDTAGATTPRRPIGLRIDADDAPGSFEIPFVPGRCDPHAIAEDKQGTVVILEVTDAAGERGRIRIPASEAARASIYDYVAAACDLPR